MNKGAKLLTVSIIISTLITSLIVFPFPASAQNDLGIAKFNQSISDEFVPGQVIVGLKQLDTSFEANAKTIGGKVIDENNVLRSLLIQVPNNAEDAFIKAIVKNPNVKFAEKNYITKALSSDPFWNDQWNMRIIDADDAWGISSINQNIVVAVIDTGVQWNHPDLAANIWNNDDACGDGIDNDSNGYTDDCRGWDFIGNENDPMDESGHGTHVAGTIGAITDNGVGVAGLAQQMIMPIRVLGPNGGPDWVVADGITYAADNGADVINLSLGCYCPSLTLTESAINYAYSNNVLVVAAAGNDNTNFPHFPSGFQNAMAVAATDKNDKKASYSNFGSAIEIAAPGGDNRGGHFSKTYVLSTYLPNNYAYAIGTSMATPHVSGVAALILSQDSSLTNLEVRNILKNTADDLGDPGWDQYFGEGRVNAYAAVNGGIPPAVLSVTGISPTSIMRTTTTLVTISGSGFVVGATVTITDGNGPKPTVTILTVDANTITANVFAKEGGPARSSLWWDVTVTNTDGGSVTISDGLIIKPFCCVGGRS